VHVSVPVKCSLSVFSFSGTLTVNIDYDDGTNLNHDLTQTYKEFTHNYSKTGTFDVKLIIPSKSLKFNQTVIIHGLYKFEPFS
jgi:hypothetical protein